MQRLGVVLAGLSAIALLFTLTARGLPDSVPESTQVAGAEVEAPQSPGSRGTRLVTPLAAIGTSHWLIEQALARDQGLPVQDDETRYGTLRGRLVWKDRRLPLANVEVAMTRSWLDTVLPTVVEDEPQNPVLLERRVTTDEFGRFVISPVPTDGNLFFLIGRDQPFMDFRKVARLPFPGQTVDLGEIYIEERGELTGRVLDPMGRGVANVRIRAVDDPFLKDPLAAEELRRERNLDVIDPQGMVVGEEVPAWMARRDALLPFPEARTLDDGSFSLPGLRPGQHRVYFRGGREAAERRALIVAEQTTELGTVLLRTGPALTGRLLYERNPIIPVVGAEVAVVTTDWGIGPPIDRTDSRGEFSFPNLPGAPVHVLYRTTAGAPWLLLDTLRPNPYADPPSYVIDRPTPALFHVVDEHGERIDDARLALVRTTTVFRPEDVRLPASVQPRRLERGGWTARLSNWNGVRVMASVPGRAPAVAAVGPDAFAPWGLTLTMIPSFKMRFSVSNSAGDPVAGAEVLAAIKTSDLHHFPGNEWQLLSVDPTSLGLTSSDGILERDGFWPTSMAFAASHPKYASSPIRERVPGADQTVHLRLQLPGRIEGVVTEARKTPVRRWRIVAEPVPPEDHALFGSPFLRPVTTITSADGSFSLPRLHPGNWILRPALPAAPGSDGWNAQEEWLQRMARWTYAREGRTIYTDLELEEPPWLEATVAGDVQLDGHFEPGLVVRLFYRGAIPPPRAAPPERSPRPERRDTRRRRGRRRGDRDRPDPSEPPEPATVSEPAPSARPLTPPTALLHSTLTDHAGRFRFFEIPQGRYLLTIEKPYQGRAQRLFSGIVDSASLLGERLPLQIRIATGALKCTVVGIDGTALAGRMLQVRERAGDAEFVVLSDDLGMIQLPQIPAGDYVLRFVDNSSVTLIDPRFRIEPGQFTMRDFQAVEAEKR